MKVGKIMLLTFVVVQLFIPLHIMANEKEKQTTSLLPSTTSVEINEHLFLLEDKEKEWNIEDVRKKSLANDFKQNIMHTPNFGYTSSAYWIYFEIENKTEFTDRYLEIPYPPLYEIDIYTFNGNGEQLDEVQIGSKYPFHERPLHYPGFVYLFNIEKNEKMRFYIRFETEGSMQMPITVWEQSGFMLEKQKRFLFLGIFYGITLVMALYNLFIYFALRHKSYLYYVLVIMSTSMISLCLNGIAFQYLWPNLPMWNMRSIVFFMSVASVFSLLFANDFLDIKRTLPKWRKYLIALIIINIFTAIFVFISYQQALNFLVFTVASMILYIILAASFALKKGIRQARFFIIAWSVFFFGVLVSMLADAAIIPLTSFTKNVWQISVALEVILLSFALADRINILQQEKNDAVLDSHVSQKKAIENLRRSDQLKDEFLAITSHELRTPLNGIIGIAETLKDGVAGDVSKDIDAHLSLIVLSGKRLSNLINDILDFSKLKNKEIQLHLAPTNLKEITDVVIMVCSPLIQGKNIRIYNTIERSMAPVYADENRLQQILYNLIGNAIKYTEEGEIVVSAKEKDHQIHVSVADTGKGIMEEELESIFDHFHQIETGKSDIVGGTGIGLSITKQLVELHDGQISVESKINKGTTFHFSLLKSMEKTISENEVASSKITLISGDDVSLIEAPSTNESAVENATILIADDEIVNLQVLVNQLTLDGYHVITAKSGKEVLQKVQENEIDIIILDIMMPKMSGYEVCQRLREHHSLMELPILMLTAKNQLQDKLISFEVGANDYLTKPCEKKELLSRVKTLVQLSHLNKQLTEFNRLLEKKVDERTIELQIANENLIDMAKSRQYLLANITHELGTPVTLIHGYVQAIREGLISPDEQNYVNLVFDRVTLLTRLIQDLADLSQLEAGQLSFDKQKVDLQEWIKNLNNAYEIEVTEANRKYSFLYEDKTDFVYTCNIDPERMNQVFSNLIWNAIKHTDENSGHISIIVRIVSEEVLFIIKDNGFGIREEELSHIFERFYKGNNNVDNISISGTGLGLTIVKEIVQVHEGKLWVESEVGKGSQFYVTLPIQKQ